MFCMKQEEANLLVKRASEAKGPISGGGPTAGWVPDHGKIYVDEETLSLSGDSRVRPAGSCCPTLLTTAAPPLRVLTVCDSCCLITRRLFVTALVIIF